MSRFDIAAVNKVHDIRLRLICRNYEIEHVLDHVLRPCFDNGNPYHSPRHCTVVARWCHDLATLCFLDGHIMSDYDMRILLVAALFHDFGHDGVSDDSHQVQRAMENCRAYLMVHSDFSEMDRDAVENIIRVTQYEGNLQFAHEPTSYSQKIIRDADLMQVMEPDHNEVILNGLRIEISRKLGRELSMKEFYDGQVHFMANMKLFTKAGAEIYEKAKPDIITSFFKMAHPGFLKEDT